MIKPSHASKYDPPCGTEPDGALTPRRVAWDAVPCTLCALNPTHTWLAARPQPYLQGAPRPGACGQLMKQHQQHQQWSGEQEDCLTQLSEESTATGLVRSGSAMSKVSPGVQCQSRCSIPCSSLQGTPGPLLTPLVPCSGRWSNQRRACSSSGQRCVIPGQLDCPRLARSWAGSHWPFALQDVEDSRQYSASPSAQLTCTEAHSTGLGSSSSGESSQTALFAHRPGHGASRFGPPSSAQGLDEGATLASTARRGSEVSSPCPLADLLEIARCAVAAGAGPACLILPASPACGLTITEPWPAAQQPSCHREAACRRPALPRTARSPLPGQLVGQHHANDCRQLARGGGLRVSLQRRHPLPRYLASRSLPLLCKGAPLLVLVCRPVLTKGPPLRLSFCACRMCPGAACSWWAWPACSSAPSMRR